MIKKKIFPYVFLLALGIISCTQNSILPESSVEMIEDILDDPYIDFLLSTGFEPENIVKTNEGYLVEGDQLFSEEYLDEFINNSDDLEERHRKLFSCMPFSDHLISAIILRVSNNVPTYWKNALSGAVSRWNAVSGTKVKFYIRGPLISGGVLSDNWVSVSAQNSGPGNAWVTGYSGCNRLPQNVYINLGSNSGSPETRIGILMHELGHVVGFQHTDSSSGTYLPGTCTNDTYSIMNATIFNYPSFNFTPCDIGAIQIFYPD